MNNSLKQIKLEYIYLIFMLFTGSILVFLTPVYQIPDEPAHFARAYQVSEMVFICPAKIAEDGQPYLTADIPTNFYRNKDKDLFTAQNRYSYEDIKNFIEEPLNAEVRIERRITNTGPYAPLVYAPQAFAGFLARNLGASAGTIYYAMRWGAVLFVSVCIFFAIHLLPEKGLLIFLLSMMPMFLIESASIAADAVVCSGSILISAYILSLIREKEELSTGKKIMLFAMAVSAGFLKQIYGTILLLYFLIPYQRMKTKKRYFLFGIFLLSVCLITSSLWLYVSTTRLQASTATVLPTSDVAQQLNFILHSPLRFAKIIAITFYFEIYNYISMFIGILGWLTIPMPFWFYVLYAAFLVIASLFGPLNITVWHRMIMFGGSLATVLALAIFEYLTWTVPRAISIAGIQGRYFIPIALMSFSILSCRPPLKHENALAFLIGSISICVTIFMTVNYFYG